VAGAARRVAGSPTGWRWRTRWRPLLTAIGAAAADPAHGYQRFGDTIDELAGKLTVHLAHEESGEEWGPRYAALNIWNAVGEPAA
jgi:hypothetical protein